MDKIVEGILIGGAAGYLLANKKGATAAELVMEQERFNRMTPIQQIEYLKTPEQRAAEVRSAMFARMTPSQRKQKLKTEHTQAVATTYGISVFFGILFCFFFLPIGILILAITMIVGFFHILNKIFNALNQIVFPKWIDMKFIVAIVFTVGALLTLIVTHDVAGVSVISGVMVSMIIIPWMLFGLLRYAVTCFKVRFFPKKNKIKHYRP